MKAIALVSVVSLCFSGCVAVPVPHDRIATPVVEGTVFDAKTKAPLAGVRISASTSNKANQTSVVSDANGKFRAYAVASASWYYFTPLNLEGICEGHFSVEMAGYKTYTFVEEYFGWGGNDGVCSSRPVKRSIELEGLEK